MIREKWYYTTACSTLCATTTAPGTSQEEYPREHVRMQAHAATAPPVFLQRTAQHEPFSGR